MPVVEVAGVSRSFGDVHALADVSLAVDAGEILGLIGHNGAGKSTLIKLMLGLIAPDRGEVTIAGADVRGAEFRNVRRRIAYLPESVVFYDNLTGLETLEFFARLKGAAREQCAGLLDQVGLTQAARRNVRGYSKGMRQRLGFAQALLGRPEILFLDEPTSGLDPASRSDVYRMIGALRDGGATVLVSTHALAEVQDRVDRAAIMHRGRLLAAGTLAELRQGAAAEVRIRARVQPDAGARVLAAMPAGVRCVEHAGASLTLQAAAGAKMPALRALAEAGDLVEDVETSAPGLQELYDRLVGSAGVAA